MNSTHTMQKIADINLDKIKTKLMHQQSGEGWTLSRANAIEKEYRRFLCMMHMYPQENFAPLVDVDTFWHYHILDTRKYAADCQQAFGHFLHHHPYVGMGADDAGDHQAYGERMHALYQATFGEACLSGADFSGTAWCSLEHTVPAPAPALASAQAAQTAWCSLDSAAQVQAEATRTAWCSLAAAAGVRKTAWCSLSDTAKAHAASTAMRGTAWCSAPDQAAATAWCSLTDQAASTAWCSGSERAQSTAWCSLDNKAAKQGQAAAATTSVAWCSGSTVAQVKATAWCSATTAQPLLAA